MKHPFVVFCAVAFLLGISQLPGSAAVGDREPGKAQAEVPNPQTWTAPPVYFIENRGQIERYYHFQLKLPRGGAFFAPDGILYQFVGVDGDADSVENLAIRIVGADPDAALLGRSPARARFNFYRGSNPDAWVAGARGFRRLVYRDIYPHIDFKVEWRDGRIKHEFRVRPGGRVADITLEYSGIEEMRIDESGRLAMRTESRSLLEEAPETFQTIEGRRIPVPSSYVVGDGGRLSYAVGDYRGDLDLVIDPSLVYSTYLGGSQLDAGRDLVVDLNLNAYVVGTTQSGDFPKTPGAHDRVKVGHEAFLSKLDPTGSDLLFSTYFGGNGKDEGKAIAFSWGDTSPVIAGVTTSSDLPVIGGYDSSLGGGSDLFVAKFSSTGALTASTYFGGSDYENSALVSVDGSGNIFLAGLTGSSDLPVTAGAVDTEFYPSPHSAIEPDNLFVTKFNKRVSSLRYSTFYGDLGFAVGGLVADFDGHAYVAGVAWGGYFPTTPGTYGEVFEGFLEDGFLLKLAPDGASVEYATFIKDPRAWTMWVTGLDVDGAGNAFVTGRTRYEPELMYEGFVSKFNSTARTRPFRYSMVPETHLPYMFWVSPLGVAVDGRGGVYATVVTDERTMITTEGAFQTAPNGCTDIYLVKLAAGDGSLEYATYLGGSSSDSAPGIAADSYGSIYLTGTTHSSDFPVAPGVFDTTYAGAGDAFVARIRDTGASGRLFINKTLLKFQVPYQSKATRSKSFKVSNKGSGKVAYLVRPANTWMTTTPSSGECKSEADGIKLTVDPKGLKPGTHHGSVRVYSVDAVNSPQQLQVSFKVKGPAIKLSRMKWKLNVTEGGDNPPDRLCRVRNKGPGKLRWRLNPTVAWLSVTPSQGNSKGEWDSFKIKIDITGLAAGIHAGTIEVSSPDTVDTETISVTLTVQTSASEGGGAPV